MVSVRKKYVSDGSEVGDMLARMQNVGFVPDAELPAYAQAVDGKGWTACMAASINGNTKLLKRLITVGADPWAKGPKGYDALKIAQKRNHGTVVRLLTDLKGDMQRERQNRRRARRRQRDAQASADPTSPEVAHARRSQKKQLYALVKFPKLKGSKRDTRSTRAMLGKLSSPYQMAAKQLKEAARDRMGAAVSLNHRHIELADQMRKKDGWVPPPAAERQF